MTIVEARSSPVVLSLQTHHRTDLRTDPPPPPGRPPPPSERTAWAAAASAPPSWPHLTWKPDPGPKIGEGIPRSRRLSQGRRAGITPRPQPASRATIRSAAAPIPRRWPRPPAAPSCRAECPARPRHHRAKCPAATLLGAGPAFARKSPLAAARLGGEGEEPWRLAKSVKNRKYLLLSNMYLSVQIYGTLFISKQN